jgi:hypothetical protein
MHRIKIVFLALFAVFAVAAATAATASAVLPLLLNVKGELVTAEQVEGSLAAGTSALLEKLNKKATKCTGVVVPKLANELKELEVLSKAFGFLGPFEIKFKGCTAENELATCTGEGAEKGEIISKGEAHLVYDALGTGTSLGAALLFLVNPDTKFTCEAFGLKTAIVVLGSVQCLVKEINVLTSKYTLNCEQKEGDAKETTYWNDEGVAKTAALLCSEKGGTEESCGELATANLTTALEVKIDA